MKILALVKDVLSFANEENIELDNGLTVIIHIDNLLLLAVSLTAHVVPPEVADRTGFFII
jgi:hypothetical protein